MMKVWTAFLLVCAAASVVAWLVALYHEKGPLTAVARFMRGLPWGGRLAVLPLFLALIVYGSVKDSGEWVTNRGSMDDAAAWMKANDNRNGRNACAIQRIDDSHIRYSYFKREKGFLYNSYLLTNVIERLSQ